MVERIVALYAIVRHTQNHRRCDSNPPLLLPPSLRDWLSEGDLVVFVSDTTDAMDLSAFDAG